MLVIYVDLCSDTSLLEIHVFCLKFDITFSSQRRVAESWELIAMCSLNQKLTI